MSKMIKVHKRLKIDMRNNTITSVSLISIIFLKHLKMKALHLDMPENDKMIKK